MIWFAKIALDILGNLAAILLSPFVCLFAKDGHLPRGFGWMETPDNLLPGDLNEPFVSSLYRRSGFYLTSVYWVGWRNRAYGLSSALRVKPEKSWPMSVKGNPKVGDDGQERGRAWFRLGPAWEFYGVWGNTFGLRVRVGYKLQPYFSNDDWSNPLWGGPVLHVSLRKLG